MVCPFKKSSNLRTSRSNLYVDSICATLVFVVVLLVACFLYDICCCLTETIHPDKESAFRFAYVHSGVILTLAGLISGFLAVYISVKVNESMAINSFHVRYGEDAMLDAIRDISNVGRRWSRSAANGFIAPIAFVRTDVLNPEGRIQIHNRKSLVTEKERFFPWTEKEDYSRRKLKNYFASALELYRSRRIGRKALRNICDNDSFRLLFTVVEPMEFVMNDKYNYDVFYELMDVMKDVYQIHAEITKSHDAVRHYWDADKSVWVTKND